MLKKIAVFQVVFSIFFASLNANRSSQKEKTTSWSSLPTSHYEISEHFKTVKEQAEKRWLTFQSNREFKMFESGKSEKTLKDEFENIQTIRKIICTTPGYEFAQNLILNDLIRAPGCAAFHYNNTVPYFNASTIYIGNKCHIASEGPRSKNIPNFFNLLTTFHVTHLVRLTDSYEGEIKKCHPYWEGLLHESIKGEKWLNIPTETSQQSIRAYDLAHWKDNQGIDPQELLALVLQVRKEVNDANGLLLVHCSAGVGRTGTFFAALSIVDAIDRKEPFSIEQIVFRLSLQRAHSVGNVTQYITLHRLAENYLMKQTGT